MKLKKIFWIGIAAAAAATVIACGGGGSDGPSARQELGGEVARFGDLEVLVHGFHRDDVVERRRVFRDVLVIPASQVTLYVAYLDALFHAQDVLELPGASGTQVSNARRDFRDARVALENASRDYRIAHNEARGLTQGQDGYWLASHLRRDQLHAAIHRAMTEDTRTMSHVRTTGSVPGLPGVQQAGTELHQFFDWEREMHRNDTEGVINDSWLPGRTGFRPGVPFPLQRVLVQQSEDVATGEVIASTTNAGTMQANFIVDTPHMTEFHSSILQGLNIFLNRYWEDTLDPNQASWRNFLTQPIIDDMTRSLNEATNVLVQIRRLRESDLTIALHPHNIPGGAVGSPTRPAIVPHTNGTVWPPASGQPATSFVQIASTAVNVPVGGRVEWLPISAISTWTTNPNGSVPREFTIGNWSMPQFAGISVHGGDHIGGAQIRVDSNARLGETAASAGYDPRSFRSIWVVARYTVGSDEIVSNPLRIDLTYARYIRLGVSDTDMVTSDMVPQIPPPAGALLPNTPRVPNRVRIDAPATGSTTLDLIPNTQRIPSAPALVWVINSTDFGFNEVVLTEGSMVMHISGLGVAIQADGMLRVNVPHNSPVGTYFTVRTEYREDPAVAEEEDRLPAPPIASQTIRVDIETPVPIAILDYDEIVDGIKLIQLAALTSTQAETGVPATPHTVTLNARAVGPITWEFVTRANPNAPWTTTGVTALPGVTLNANAVEIVNDTLDGHRYVRARINQAGHPHNGAYDIVRVEWVFGTLTLVGPTAPVNTGVAVATATVPYTIAVTVVPPSGSAPDAEDIRVRVTGQGLLGHPGTTNVIGTHNMVITTGTTAGSLVITFNIPRNTPSGWAHIEVDLMSAAAGAPPIGFTGLTERHTVEWSLGAN